MAMTKEERLKMLQVVSIAGTIKDLGSAPTGPMYMALMHRWPDMSAAEFNDLINILEHSNAVRRSGHVLTWLNNPMWNTTVDKLDALARRVEG